VANGRLGAVVFGGIVEQQPQLNEDTLWGTDKPINRTPRPGCRASGHLIEEGRYREVPRGRASTGQAGAAGAVPDRRRLRPTLPAAVSVTDYRRSPYLDRAITATRYVVEGVASTREVFATAVDQNGRRPPDREPARRAMGLPTSGAAGLVRWLVARGSYARWAA
jgi:alpha-L-fucosidase 2